MEGNLAQSDVSNSLGSMYQYLALGLQRILGGTFFLFCVCVSQTFTLICLVILVLGERLRAHNITESQTRTALWI